ncbi:MAG: signal recognition particle-docking protein FtsY [Rhodospirillaceae bacterium]|nr:signal recognition particle-docking protein FtsY [Rhodospirillaceae bacterium]
MSSESWLSRLRKGLSKSSSLLTEGVTAALTGRRLDAEAIEELEETLILADLGPAMASRIAKTLSQKRFEKNVESDEVLRFLTGLITEVLEPIAKPLIYKSDKKPHIILAVGVNGSGKTTTVGKLAQQHTKKGRKVMLAAADTFRAAAVEQLEIWGNRTCSTVVSTEIGADAASLAYKSIERAKSDGTQVLLIDTAGRLHNKDNLMAELEKIVRVIKKIDPEAPHDCVLVLDATTGQNAIAQVEFFQKTAPITGLIVTKLDGSAKGGVLVALADKFKLPVHAVGVGETAEDLQPFEAHDFAESLVGLKIEC